jgi:Ni/Co efflux regulator RcnB
MKTQKIVAAVAAASLAFSSGAFAQSTGAQDQAQQRDNRGNFVRDPGPNRIDESGQFRGPTQGIRRAEQVKAAEERQQQRADQRNYRGDQRNYRGDQRNYRGEARGFDNRNHNRNYDRRDYSNRNYDYRNYGYRDGGYRGQGRGVGPSHSWYRGDRLPHQYRTRHYVVDDWRGHHLYAPPSGYHWVQSGGDYLLVAVATGIIASILLNQ